jgi:CelD/BcsL family acetyltransferase involved in cellulose biosynthesis
MRVVEVNKYKGFLSLEKAWDEVLLSCNNSVFSTWEWLSIWWKHFGTGKKLLLLLAEEDDKIIGIAPLMYSVHKMFGLRMGKIEFVGTPQSDYNDFILTSKKEECVGLFIDHLSNLSEKWDCIDLTDIPEYSDALPFLIEMSKIVKPIYKCPYTPLSKSYNIFLRGLSHKHARDLQRNLKRLERKFEVDFVDYSGAQFYVEGMNLFLELHQKRWEQKGFPAVSQRYRNFHFDIAQSFSKRGWLGLSLLRLSGKPVAALYGFKYREKFYYYLSGFDPRYSRYSVGNLMISGAIEQSIQEGLVEFDFMRGAEEYKDRWNTLARWNHEAILTRKGVRANIENWLYKEYWRQGNLLKYFLKNSPRVLKRTR